jgi:hypothetical protein
VTKAYACSVPFALTLYSPRSTSNQERFSVFFVGFPQAADIGIVDAFELLILEILSKINLNQTVGIQKNDLNYRKLKCESLISQSCVQISIGLSYKNSSQKDNLQKYNQYIF